MIFITFLRFNQNIKKNKHENTAFDFLNKNVCFKFYL